MYILIFPDNVFRGDIIMEWTASEVALAILTPFLLSAPVFIFQLVTSPTMDNII